MLIAVSRRKVRDAFGTGHFRHYQSSSTSLSTYRLEGFTSVEMHFSIFPSINSPVSAGGIRVSRLLRDYGQNEELDDQTSLTLEQGRNRSKVRFISTLNRVGTDFDGVDTRRDPIHSELGHLVLESDPPDGPYHRCRK
jgi:hypothetical protein